MDFTVNRECGQLTIEERKLLYGVVILEKPRIAFEVGTWEGGGSTYFISSAMHETDIGILYTVERNPEMYKTALENFFLWPDLARHVIFNCGSSLSVFPPLLKGVENVDFVFLDGENNPKATVKDFEMFEPYMGKGSVLACHDWGALKMERMHAEIYTRGFTHYYGIDSLMIFKRSIIA